MLIGDCFFFLFFFLIEDDETIANVRNYWFAYFGLLEILQSGNGNEFKNALFVREVMD